MHSVLNIIGVAMIAGWLTGCSDEQPAQPPMPQTSPPATAPSAPAPPAAMPAPAQPEGTGAPAGGGGETQVAQGEQVYNSTCAACHAMGVAGAPKLGDKAAWAARIAQGEQVLFQHAKIGFQGKSGFMPPKGGNPALTDEQLRAAIDYMTRKSK